MLSLPSKLAPALAGETSLTAIQDKLKTEVFAALAELASGEKQPALPVKESRKRSKKGDV
jgi:hypothetical protein